MGICFSEVVESKFLPKDLNPKLLPEFVPPIKSGRVIKVYDGDTITIASKIPKLKNSQIYKFHVRLNGIDTPEIKTHDEDEKNIAIKARDALSDKILNKDVILKNVKIEKYGSNLSIRQVGDDKNKFSPESFKIMVSVDKNEIFKPNLSIDFPIFSNIKFFINKLKSKILKKKNNNFINWINWCHEKKKRNTKI